MSETAPPPAGKVRTLNCPNCGGSVTLRGFAHSLTVVCVQCLSVLDAKSPSLQVLQTFQARERVHPLIPLGTRGKLHGTQYEVIGFQTRQIMVEMIPYEWREYLLFNPYKGFRYLAEYDGHWNDVKPIKGVPEVTSGGKPEARWLGEKYRHFQSARAETTYVMGEFPWQVRVGESAQASDFVAPPRMLSQEVSEGEVNWSLGEYMEGAQIWQNFQLPGAPPPARGIYANQPSPFADRTKSAWMTCLWLMAGLFALLMLASMFMRQEEVFRQKYTYSAASRVEASHVTSEFELKGRTSNVEVNIATDLDNDSAYFNLALINAASGQAYDFGREVSYYHGRDSDGNWKEGRAVDSVIVPTIPAGRYYLRVEPETEPNPAAFKLARTIRYEIWLRRDVPINLFFFLAAGLLLIPPVIVTLRRAQFEQARWAESGHAGDDEEGKDDD